MNRRSTVVTSHSLMCARTSLGVTWTVSLCTAGRGLLMYHFETAARRRNAARRCGAWTVAPDTGKLLSLL